MPPDEDEPLSVAVVTICRNIFFGWFRTLSPHFDFEADRETIPREGNGHVQQLPLIERKKMWPDPHARFCTEVLKVLPTISWLSVHDPEGRSEMILGVRREESFERRLWPEFVEGSDKNEGRDEWSPMVEVKEIERNALVVKAGFQVLPHRSRECRCVLANSQDIKTWTEEDIRDIEAGEALLKKSKDQSNNFMFKPHDKKGNPHGIRAVVEWAKQVKTKEPARSGCDGGHCVS